MISSSNEIDVEQNFKGTPELIPKVVKTRNPINIPDGEISSFCECYIDDETREIIKNSRTCTLCKEACLPYYASNLAAPNICREVWCRFCFKTAYKLVIACPKSSMTRLLSDDLTWAGYILLLLRYPFNKHSYIVIDNLSYYDE